MLKFLVTGIFSVTTLLTSIVHAETPAKRPPQYVLISFDGSLSIPMWEATRQLAHDTKSNFTYYISGVYFVTSPNKKLYVGPRRPTGGSSAIGFGGSVDDLKKRLIEVDAAIKDGNAISSHANGHFGGGKGGENWSFEEWTLEFNAFDWILNNVFENNQITNFAAFSKEYWQDILKPHLKGFRAPQLSINDGMYKTLANKDHFYSYDSSQSGTMGYWPEKNAYGTWNMPLGYIPVAGTKKQIISMDYNFYVMQSGANPSPQNAEAYEKQMYLSYLNYFKTMYEGNRGPVNIGHHFSTWNGGAYWKALQKFAKEVCSQPEVVCTTFDQYEAYLESLPPETRAAYKKAQFDVSDRPVLPAEITHPEGLEQIMSLSRFEDHLSFDSDYNVGCNAQSHDEAVDVEFLH